MSEKPRKRKEEEEKINPFIEYFYLIGPESIKTEKLYKFFSKEINNINPKILSKFPPTERPLTSFKDEIIISHCFPNGYKIEEYDPGQKIFHFSLQNIFPQKEEIKIYFTGIKFYESLSKYSDIKQKKKSVIIGGRNVEEFEGKFNNLIKRQSAILKETPLLLLKKKEINEKYYIPKVICFSSTMPFPFEFSYLLNKLIKYVSEHIKEEKTEEKKDENNNNINNNSNKNTDITINASNTNNTNTNNTNTNESNINESNTNNNTNDSNKSNNNTNDNNTTNNNKNIILPIEKIIEKIITEVPMPMRGIFHIKFLNNNEFFKEGENELIVKQRMVNEYYFPSHIFQSIFIFNSNDIMEIYKSLLLEIPVLFFSSDIERLTNIYESFLCLLYPLNYQCPHVSVLPDINSAMIQNFESFFFGINQRWINENDTKNYFERNYMQIINKAILICDLDNAKIVTYFKKLENEHIVYYRDLGKYINNNQNNTSSKNINHENKFLYMKYSLPSHYCDKAKKRMDNFRNANKEMKLNEYNEEYNKQIGENIFYYFLVCILYKYNNYLYNNEIDIINKCKDIFSKGKKTDINSLFNIQKFFNECKSSETNFYEAFFKTELFADFIRRKYYNKKKDKTIFLNFDETIIKKRNKGFLSKKYNTPFITIQIFDNSNNIDIGNYTNFTEDELKYMSENKKELLDYYQSYNGKEFKYLVFPKLLYDNKFFSKLIKSNDNKENKDNKDKSEDSTTDFDNFSYRYNYRAFTFTQVYKDLIQEIFNDKTYFKIYAGDLIVQDKFNPNKTLYDGEIQNSLLLLWLRMFCLTFYYCDKEEKNLRFYEMINITKRLIYIKDDIFSLILSTLEKYGTEIMMIQFFSTLSSYNYIQYSYLSHKLLKESQIKSNIKSMTISNTSLTIYYYTENHEDYIIPHINKEDIDNIKERTFSLNNNKNNNNENIKENESVYFSHNIKCDKCGENLEISGLTLNYKGMIKSHNLLCQCQNPLKNKITIKVNGKYYKIKLYEPYYLYKIISTEILEKYGNSIPLDELRIKYKDFFWNCIWYFGSQGLSYDMLLKYKDDKSDSALNEEKPTEKKVKKKKIVQKHKKRFENLEITNNDNSVIK